MRANTAKHPKMINLQRRHFQSLISPCPALRGAELKRSSRVCLRSLRSSHFQPLSQTPGVWLVGLPWLTIERASKIKILWGASLFSKSLRRGLENWWLHFSLFQYTFLMLTLLYPVGTTPFPRTVLKLHGCNSHWRESKKSNREEKEKFDILFSNIEKRKRNLKFISPVSRGEREIWKKVLHFREEKEKGIFFSQGSRGERELFF